MPFHLRAVVIFLALAAPAAAREPLQLRASHEASARPKASLLIELVNWHCFWNNQSTVSVDGAIKNISTYPIPKVAARIVVTDADGNTIGDGDKFADKAPFTPEDIASFDGQISLTKGSKRPLSCSIDFIDGDGTYLRWRESAAH